MSGLRSSRSDDERAVSSPIVVLISVAMFSLALSIYMGYSGSLIDMEQTGREISEPTMERIWDDISDRGAYNKSKGLENAIEQETLPTGQNVYVAITYIDSDGEQQVIERVKFEEDGSTSSYSQTPVPPDIDASNRTIGVRRDPQDVKGARLHVAVA